MTTRTDWFLKQALELSVEERALLAEQLILSLDPQADADVELAWQEEVARRLREVDEGRARAEPWEAVRARLRKSIRARP